MTATTPREAATVISTPDLDQMSKIVTGIAAHPMRLQIVMALRKPGKEHSPSELSKIIGVPIGNVSYHVRQMRAAGVLKETRQEPRRGAVEHFYMLTDEAQVWRKRLKL